MKNFKNIYLLAVCILLAGCSKFLEEQSQDLAYATSWQKLDEVMQGEVYMKHYTTPPNTSFKEDTKAAYFPWLNVMDDDITEYISAPYYLSNIDDVFGFYTWQADPFVDLQYIPRTDDTWSKVYKSINAANIVIAQADKLQDDIQQLRRIKGEALFLRANYYFYLVNTYASAYQPQTATKDLGVPLKTTEFVEDKFFTRSTVDSVYRQMVSDLESAENCFQGIPSGTLYHVNLNAVNLLQSRIYLYMQSWDLAAAAADKVIARKPTLFSLTDYKPRTSFFAASSPESIFTQGGNAMIYLMGENRTKSLTPSPALMKVYDINDLRRGAFFETDNVGKLRYTKMYRSSSNGVVPTEVYSDNNFLRNAEAYLNKAEAAAMLGNSQDANTALNTLRKARFDAVSFVAVNLTGKALIDFVRDERRRELCFEGHRWFDLKRYAVNNDYPYRPTITHTYSQIDYGSPVFVKAILTLLPGDPAYLIPIPKEAIVFSQGALIQNPVRPNRAF